MWINRGSEVFRLFHRSNVVSSLNSCNLVCCVPSWLCGNAGGAR